MGQYLHDVWWWVGMTVAAVSLFLMVREEIKKRRVRRDQKKLEAQQDEIENIKRKKDMP